MALQDEFVDSARLRIAPLRDALPDRALYRALYGDADVMRHIAPMVAPSQVDASFDRACRDSARQPGLPNRWTLRLRESDALVGLVGTFHAPAERALEFGVMLLPLAQRLGLAREAFEALTAWLEPREDIHVLWSRHAPDNAAMARVLERAGFCRTHGDPDHWRWSRASPRTLAKGSGAL